jgi:hypothetical protein
MKRNWPRIVAIIKVALAYQPLVDRGSTVKGADGNVAKHPFLSICAAVLCFLLTLQTPGCSESKPRHTRSGYVREVADAEGVIVFLHGFTGNAVETWTNSETGAYWPELLTTDPTFNDFNIYVHEYTTSLGGRVLSPDELGSQMQQDFTAKRVLSHRRLIFLCHSLGGIALRGYLLKFREPQHPPVAFAYFFGTPSEGTAIANLASKLWKDNPQIDAIKEITRTSYLADQLRNWKAAQFTFPSYAAYETLPTFGSIVVPLASVTALTNRDPVPLEFNHIDIVKPRAIQDDRRYDAFRNAFVESGHLLPIQGDDPFAPDRIWPGERVNAIGFLSWVTEADRSKTYGWLETRMLAFQKADELAAVQKRPSVTAVFIGNEFDRSRNVVFYSTAFAQCPSAEIMGSGSFLTNSKGEILREVGEISATSQNARWFVEPVTVNKGNRLVIFAHVESKRSNGLAGFSDPKLFEWRVHR